MNNPNNPQLNLTSASDVVVRNCIIIGERNNTNVGGIVVSDLYGVANNAHTLIEDNEIRDNRFGLSLYNNQTAVVRNNTILNIIHMPNIIINIININITNTINILNQQSNLKEMNLTST